MALLAKARENPHVTSAPLWVLLLVALLGVAGSVTGTVLGVLVTQRRSDRREDQRWTRERAREHDAWAREDAKCTFDQRCNAYIDFSQQLRAAALAIHNAAYELGPALEFGWNLSLYESLLRLRVFASPEAAGAAQHAYDGAWRWGDAGGSALDARFHDGENEFDQAEHDLLSVIRTDLGVDAGTSSNARPHDEEGRLSP